MLRDLVEDRDTWGNKIELKIMNAVFTDLFLVYLGNGKKENRKIDNFKRSGRYKFWDYFLWIFSYQNCIMQTIISTVKVVYTFPRRVFFNVFSGIFRFCGWGSMKQRTTNWIELNWLSIWVFIEKRNFFFWLIFVRQKNQLKTLPCTSILVSFL